MCDRVLKKRGDSMVKIHSFFIVLLIVQFFGFMLFSGDTPFMDFKQLKLDKDMASKFATMAMRCVEKEYPNKKYNGCNYILLYI